MVQMVNECVSAGTLRELFSLTGGRNMKRMIFAGVLLACGAFAGAAAAADMSPRYAQPQRYLKAPAYNPIYSWTGFYLGLNGGGGWGRSTWDRTRDLGLSGGVIGGTPGFNLPPRHRVPRLH